MKMKTKLSILFFLQFAVWGAYLTSMGGYLAEIGLGSQIGWFYSVQGFVSIIMPTLFGIVADRYVEAQRVLGVLHLLSAALMCYVGFVGITSPDIAFSDIFPAYAFAVAFYMPTIGLSMSASYSALEKAGEDKVACFPKIRIWGTIGFIISMWIVDLFKIQHTAAQFFVSAAWGVLIGLYSFSLPRCPVSQGGDGTSLAQSLGLDAFAYLKQPRLLTFFLFSMLLGVALQITNGYANPYISSFGSIESYKDSFAVEHANILISLSQISETLCILLIPFFLKRYGIKTVVLIAMTAWALRFALFVIGSPAWPGVLCLVLSMIVYGVAFDFFNISGSLFVDSEFSEENRSSAQGLFMLMTNGLGASIGTLTAQAVINHFVVPTDSPEVQMAGWQTSWLIFAAYAATIGLLFALLFKSSTSPKAKPQSQA